MTHIPLRDGQLYICPACRWRAVLTTRGDLVVTEPGDTTASHHAGPAPTEAERHAWMMGIVSRLMQQDGDVALRRRLKWS